MMMVITLGGIVCRKTVFFTKHVKLIKPVSFHNVCYLTPNLLESFFRLSSSQVVLEILRSKK